MFISQAAILPAVFSFLSKQYSNIICIYDPQASSILFAFYALPIGECTAFSIYD